MFDTDWRHIFFNVAVACSAMIVAVAPPAMLFWALDSYAMQRAETALYDVASRMVGHSDMVLNEGADALAALAPAIRLSCESGARQSMQNVVAQSTFIRGIKVVSPQGDVLCSSSDLASRFEPAANFRVARSKSIGIALAPALKGQQPLLQMRWQGGMNTLYAFIAPNSLRTDFLPGEWQAQAKGSISLDDGGVLQGIETKNNRPFKENEKLLSTTAQSERFPIHADLTVQQSIVLAPYKSVSTLIGVGGAMLALMLIVFVLQALRRRPLVEDAISSGIKNKEFIPYFQPVMNLQNGELIGCEVLIRWKKSDGTIIPPGAFIQKAEESGLAVEMTRQLMAKVRDELGSYYAGRPELKVAFNLFAGHFSDLTTVDDVREIFKTGGIRYSQIVLEVTERYPLPNMNRALTAITALQDLGCRVALDDAGTGHGGLAYLQKLGMDQVKIDKLFVDTITEGVTTAPIIDSMIEMAKQMNMEIVAEGVETIAQFDYLKNKGVCAAQGYLFAKPMPAKSYIQLIETMTPLDGKKSNVVYLDVA
ncbi:MAG: EAL domain-containing protein [Pseudomonadota bacterium]